jgi:hypothetical protein
MTAGWKPEVERLVDALHAWPQEEELQPRPGFVNEVAEQLHQLAARRRTMRSWPSRILAGVTGAVALVAFGFIVIALFSRGEAEPPVVELETPSPSAATAAIEEDVIATERDEPTATLPPTTSATPSSVAVAEWPVYENDFLGYRFSYPPEARISTLGVTGFPTDELPENRTSEEYREQLEEVYPHDLCVSVQYQTGFVTFVPSADVGGRYTGPCGVTGVGDYDVTDLVETVLIDDFACTVSGWEMRERGESAAWHGEFYFLRVSDSITIHYGSMSGTQEQFLDAREALLQIVTSFRAEQGLDCDAAGNTASSARPEITLTLRDVSTTQYETNVSLQIAIAGDHAVSHVTGANLASPTLVDDQGNQYEPWLGSGASQTTADGLLVEVRHSFRPGAHDAQTLFLETGLELRAVATTAVTLDLRGVRRTSRRCWTAVHQARWRASSCSLPAGCTW